MFACNKSPSPIPTPAPAPKPTAVATPTPIPTPIETIRPSPFTIKLYSNSTDTTPTLKWNPSTHKDGVIYILRVWNTFDADKILFYEKGITGLSKTIKKLPQDRWYSWMVTAQNPDSGKGINSNIGTFKIYGTPTITKITFENKSIRVHMTHTIQVEGIPRLKLGKGYSYYIAGHNTNIIVFENGVGPVLGIELNGGRMSTINNADLILNLPDD